LALLAQNNCSCDEAPIEPYDPLLLVDPMIGTGGQFAEVVALNPGASSPFGMTQTGPDTRFASGTLLLHHFAGYHYPDTHISGFSHQHANGMGVADFGSIMVMPRAHWRPELATEEGRMAPFEHRDEGASPGYYSVKFSDDATRTEIVATPRGAIHRYRFAAGSKPTVLLDLGHTIGNVEIDQAQLEIDEASIDASQVIMGSYSRRGAGLKVWAHLEFEPEPETVGTWQDPEHPEADKTSASGQRAGAWVEFPQGTTEVHLRIALSHVDSSGAQSNFEAELAGRDFDSLLEDVESQWRQALNKVRVQGGTEEQRIIFHTAHYHALLWPSIYQDIDGRFRGMDDEIHSADFTYYSNFSMWDTFRTTHPWFLLSAPQRQADMARSLVTMGEQGGSMPRWPLASSYTGGMVGTPAAQILAETALKGVTGWDQQAAFDLLVRHATEAMPEASRDGIDSYLELHYLPMDEIDGSTAKALEYAWNDHALALWAEALGEPTWAQRLGEQSRWWRNSFDPQQGFFTGRNRDGSFRQNLNPDRWVSDYVEGNAWHYRWGVPQQFEAMIELQYDGDSAAFSEDFARYWDKVIAEPNDLLADTYYWHGNEPDLHYPWLPALAGDRQAAVRALRHVMKSRYGLGPDGLDGNDDAGTLSSWYLFAACGLYPIAGTPDYILGEPIFDRIEIDRGEESLLIQRHKGQRSAVFLGDSQREISARVEHSDLINARGLRFTTSP
jgi:predicted alpha-1,2-mannosidase